MDLSYYDGSPMIAYFIKPATFLFGDNLFALNFVAILSTFLSSFILYKTARLFLTKKASFFSSLLWLFSPLVTIDLLKQTTYDTPLCVFWAFTVYQSISFIKFKKTATLYWLGLSIGCMLLSKYTGISLVLGLIIFVLITPYRSLFKSWHFYLSIGLSFFLFTPVLLWNFQHQWVSFIYQLSTHQISEQSSAINNLSKGFFYTILPSLNLALAIPFIWPFVTRLFLLYSQRYRRHFHLQSVFLCWIICSVFLVFYLLLSTKITLRATWFSPYLFSSSLLAGFYFQRGRWRKLGWGIVGIYGLISALIILNNTYWFSFITPKKLVYYRLMEQFNQRYSIHNLPVLTAGWIEARMLFFLKNKPYIYTLGCQSPANQYAFWSQGIQNKIASKDLKKSLFIDKYERSSCLKEHFDHCDRLPTNPYYLNGVAYEIFAYECINF